MAVFLCAISVLLILMGVATWQASGQQEAVIIIVLGCVFLGVAYLFHRSDRRKGKNSDQYR